MPNKTDNATDHLQIQRLRAERLRAGQETFLPLDGYRFVDYESLQANVLVDAEVVAQPVCPQCGTTDSLKRFGTKLQVFRDITVNNARGGIRVKRQRYRCRFCQRTFYEALPHMDDTRRMTQRLLRHIAHSSLSQTFTSLAESTGLHEKTIRNIARSFFDLYLQGEDFALPAWLGIDEVYIRDKHAQTRSHRAQWQGKTLTDQARQDKRSFGVLTDLKRKALVEFLPDNKSNTIERYLINIPLANRDRVEVVCIDFCAPYRRIVRKHLPKATLVVDKFHLLRKFNDALDQVRIHQTPVLSGRSSGYPQKYGKRLLVARRKALSHTQRDVLARWFACSPLLKDAYELKEMAYEIWEDALTEEEARLRYQHWCEAVNQTSGAIRQAFQKTITLIHDWEMEVFAYFHWKHVTNAYTESLNGTIKCIIQAGRGYSFTMLRGKLLGSFAYKKRALPIYRKMRWQHPYDRDQNALSQWRQDVAERNFSERIPTLSPPPQEKLRCIEDIARRYIPSRRFDEEVPIRPVAEGSCCIQDGIQRPLELDDILNWRGTLPGSDYCELTFYDSEKECMEQLTKPNGRMRVEELQEGAFENVNGLAGRMAPEDTRPYRLSKSRYSAGLQCAKRLHLETYHKELATPPDPKTQSFFEMGHTIGRLAQLRFPNGVLIDADREHSEQALRWTGSLLTKPSIHTIYEGAFKYNDVLVRVDVLHRVGSGSWQLIECKSSTRVKDEHLHDVAIQAYVLAGAGVPISSSCLLHVNKRYMHRGGTPNPQQFFVLKDLSPQVRAMEAEVAARVVEMMRYLDNPTAPEVEPGSQCYEPHTCPFIAHCTRAQAEMQRQLETGDLLSEDFNPNHGPSNEPQPVPSKRQPYRGPNVSEERIDPQLKAHLISLIYPIHHVHLDSFSSGIPLHVGTRPYERLPFHWTNAIESKDGSLNLEEALTIGLEDPRETFIMGLLQSLGEKGSIIVFSAHAHKLLTDLGRTFPHFKTDIAQLKVRCVDLRSLIQRYYPHPLLPLSLYRPLPYPGPSALAAALALLPSTFARDGIQDWDDNWATRQYRQLMQEDKTQDEKTKLRNALLDRGRWSAQALRELRQVLWKDAQARATGDMGA